LIELNWPEPQYATDQAQGEVLYIDSFGNIITNLLIEQLFPAADHADLIVTLNGHDIVGLQTTYGQRQSGELIALGDSQGRLEIARVNGNAAAVLGALPGECVRVWQRSAEKPQS
jgi:S-adenosyl-L-methionine hydrolase (adenosine-forming)